MNIKIISSYRERKDEKDRKQRYSEILNLWEIQCCAWQSMTQEYFGLCHFLALYFRHILNFAMLLFPLLKSKGHFSLYLIKPLEGNLWINTWKTLGTSVWHQGSCFQLAPFVFASRNSQVCESSSIPSVLHHCSGDQLWFYYLIYLAFQWPQPRPRGS